MKGRAEEEKNALPQLAAGNSLSLEPGLTYCLLPRAWLVQWRAFLAAAQKRIVAASELDPPPPLPDSMQAVLCSCHPSCGGRGGRLNYPPPELLKRCSPRLPAAFAITCCCSHVAGLAAVSHTQSEKWKFDMIHSCQKATNPNRFFLSREGPQVSLCASALVVPGRIDVQLRSSWCLLCVECHSLRPCVATRGPEEGRVLAVPPV